MARKKQQNSSFEFDTEPKKKKKKKVMLWIEIDALDRIEAIRPTNLTTQECIRQILTAYLADVIL